MNKLTIIIILALSNLLMSDVMAEVPSSDVRKAIELYIEGSSYSKTDVLSEAFHPQATLYLTTRDGFSRFSPAQYADFFAHRKAGEFNGRVGKILSIEVVNDIAMAKASIELAERDLYYIDLFLLKKTNDRWQIISKTATQLQTAAQDKSDSD